MICNGCDKEIASGDFAIMVRLKADSYYVIYSLCSYECRDDVYADKEGGFSDELYEESEGVAY